MAGNEIAQLAAVIKLNDGNVGQKLELIKKGLGQTDQKFNQLSKAVNDSSVKMNTAKIALDKYKQEIGNVKKATEEQKKKLAELTNAYNQQRLGLAQNTLELKKYNIEQAKAATQGQGLTGVFSRMGLTMQGVVIGGLVGITAALTAITVSTVKTAGVFEQLAISFDVLIGNTDRAKAFTNELINLANVTPMTTEGLARNAKLLLAMGESIDNVIPVLKMLGDISGGSQEKLNSLALVFGQIGARGRLTGDNLRQLQEAGFDPLNIIAQKTGETMSQVRDRMEKGNISFSEFKQTMVDATSEGGRFYGMMNKQSQTLEGRLSTLSDKWQLVSKAIGDLFLPFAKDAVNALIGLADFTQKAIVKLGQLAEALSSPFTLTINTIERRITGETRGKAGRIQELEGLIKLEKEYQNKQKQELQKWRNFEKQEADNATKKFRTEERQRKEKEYNESIQREKKYQKDIQNIKNPPIVKKTKIDKNKITSGFADSTKENTGEAKKGKSTDTLLNEQASLLKAQSDLEISQNDYTDSEIIARKIELQKKLIEIYKSTSTKGQTAQMQANTELLNLEKEYRNKLIDEKIRALQTANEKEKILNETKLSQDLQQTNLTEVQKTQLKQNYAMQQAQAEVDLQNKILQLKLKGKNDASQLSQREFLEYQEQLLNKLNAEKNYQNTVAQIKQQGKDEEVRAAEQVADGITDSLKSAIDGTKSLSEAFKDMLSTIAVNIAKSGIEKMLTKMFSGFSTTAMGGTGVISNFLGKFSPGLGKVASFLGFANGGVTPTNEPVWVGEDGPELMSFKKPATITSNQDSMKLLENGQSQQPQQNVLINHNINIKAFDSADVARTLQKGEAKASIIATTKEAIRTGKGGLRQEIKNV